MRSRIVVGFIALLMVVAPIATAAERDDAEWREFYFPSSDGITMLHADVLRPVGMSMDVPTPVIMTVSPYTNHSGSTSPNDLGGTGPNPRFYDFLDLSGALDKGYTYVMVDLPGDGGSAGCNDWGGAREQAGVKAAVEWAAQQPWSNGKVAL
ncbi:MAG: CocE/NonD family hydrolase, partial [Actinomycetota bacterium]